MLLLKNRRKVVATAVLLVAVSMVALGLWGLAQRSLVTEKTSPVIPLGIVTHSTETPDETELKEECSQYTVADNQPRIIALPGDGVGDCVQRVGVDQNNAMAVPTNIHLAGWYTGSVAPGEPGVSIINGHAGGRYRDGIFRHLTDLSEGQVFKIQMGDLSWREFRIMSVTTYNVQDAGKVMFNDDATIDAEVHLITCDGVFDDDSQTYDKRTIVVAEYAKGD